MNRKPFINLVGQQFGYLCVLELADGNCNSNSIWKCKCKCGETKNVRGDDLKRGMTKSCGCYHKERTSQARSKHNRRHTTEYNSWCGMRDRCYNSKSHKYKDYGLRGISVCQSWTDKESGFVNFFNDMGEKPTSKHTLDRINVHGNYEKSNCRWALPKTQSRNKQYNHLLTYDGKTLTLAGWEDITGISQDTIHARVNYYGWTTEEALTITDGRKTKREINNK